MSNFVEAYNSLPHSIQHVLKNDDIEALRTDAQLYLEKYEEHGGCATWATAAHLYCPEETTLQQATEALERLYHKALRLVARRTDTSIQLDLDLDKRDAASTSEISLDATVTKKALANWKHWKPSNTALPSTTKRQIEITLRSNWINKMLDNLLPYAADIPYMVKYAGTDERLKWRALFGNARWGTVKHHCLVLIKVVSQQKDCPIPWTDAKVTTQILFYKVTAKTANQLRNYWNTLKFLCKTFGCPPPSECHDIVAIYKSTVDDITTQTKAKPKKAIMLPLDAILALETAATDSGLPITSRYAAAVFRLMLGNSARFDDMQHTAPNTFVEYTSTLEAKPWQTKSLERTSTKHHKVLISTKHTFKQVQWWKIISKTMAYFLKQRPHMDYFLPQPNSCFTAFLDRPCTYHAALTWFKHLLYKYGVDRETVEKVTLHSLRLWMAEMAYRARVPRSDRQHIGQWAQQSTADVYTREHREVYTRIWSEVVNRMPNLHNTTTQEMLPVDPMDDRYLEPAPSNAEEHSPTEVTEHLYTADKYPKNLGGPLTIAINNKATGKGQDRACKIHYFKKNGSALCNNSYMFRGNNCTIITTQSDWKEALNELDYKHDKPMARNRPCVNCNNRALPPDGWQTEEQPEDHEPEDDSDFTASEKLTDDENDTASEDEAIPLTESDIIQ